MELLVFTDILVFTTVRYKILEGEILAEQFTPKIGVIIFWQMLKLVKAPKIIIMHLLFTGQLKL